MTDPNPRTPPFRPVRTALVGLGGHGRTIQRAAEASPYVEVAAVYDLSAAEAADAAARFGCPAADSYEALLAREDVEAVALVTPNHLHRAQAEAAFAAGKHVFLEKPIANTMEDARAIVRAAEQSGRTLLVGHNMRRSRSARLARRMIEEGRLGRVASVELHFSSDTGLRLPPDAWRLRPDQCPLLPVMQLGIHAIDLVHYLIGPIREIGGFARSVAVRPPVVDAVTAVFTAGEVPGTMVSNYCSQVTFQYRIAGSEGTLVATPHTLWFRRREDTDGFGEGPAETHDFRAHELESYTLQMDVFAGAVRGRAEPETDGRAGLRALAAVTALERAIESNRIQTVEEA